MKRGFVFLIVVVFLLVIGTLAISAQINGESGVGKEVSDFVSNFALKRGIASEDIKGITKVDFNSLPKEVNIENVDDTNIAIYEVNYSTGSEDKKVYVIAYSVEQLRAQGDLIVAQDKRNFLDFGFSGIMRDTSFLETATGVVTGEAKGYVMPRDGSITAISTNLEIIQSNPGQIEIIILKNGHPISFGNTIAADSVGTKKDYDVQAKDTVSFVAGDVISVLIKEDGDLAWRDVITLLEITTVD